MSSRVVKGTIAASGSPWVVRTTHPLAPISSVRRISARASATGHELLRSAKIGCHSQKSRRSIVRISQILFHRNPRLRLFECITAREGRARRLAELLALVLQGSLLVRHTPQDGRRLLRFASGGDAGLVFRTLPADTDFDHNRTLTTEDLM